MSFTFKAAIVCAVLAVLLIILGAILGANTENNIRDTCMEKGFTSHERVLGHDWCLTVRDGVLWGIPISGDN